MGITEGTIYAGRKSTAIKGDEMDDGWEIISEGYFILLSEVDGVIKELYVSESEYVEVDTALIEVEVDEPEEEA